MKEPDIHDCTLIETTLLELRNELSLETQKVNSLTSEYADLKSSLDTKSEELGSENE
jgi:hypothetical protein